MISGAESAETDIRAGDDFDAGSHDAGSHDVDSPVVDSPLDTEQPGAAGVDEPEAADGSVVDAAPAGDEAAAGEPPTASPEADEAEATLFDFEEDQ